ncbi:MAG: acylphosphatase [Roseicyclus sp.]
MTEEKTAFMVNVTGRVQGVSFRAWTKSEADARGLSGWVRNEPDGSVSALIEGPAEAVAGMLKAFEKGPALARVEAVSTMPGVPTDRTGFEVYVNGKPQ